jgi:hypothetical protein
MDFPLLVVFRSVSFPFSSYACVFSVGIETHIRDNECPFISDVRNLDNFPERKKTKGTFTGGQDVNPPALPSRTQVEGRHFRRPSEMFIGPPSIRMAAGSDRLLTVSSGVNLVHAVPKATILVILLMVMRL